MKLEEYEQILRTGTPATGRGPSPQRATTKR